MLMLRTLRRNLGQTADVAQTAPEKVSRLYAVMSHLLADLRGRPGTQVGIEDMVSLSSLGALLDMVKSGKIRQRTRAMVVDYLFSLPGMTSANLMFAHEVASRTVRAHGGSAFDGVGAPIASGWSAGGPQDSACRVV